MYGFIVTVPTHFSQLSSIIRCSGGQLIEFENLRACLTPTNPPIFPVQIQSKHWGKHFNAYGSVESNIKSSTTQMA